MRVAVLGLVVREELCDARSSMCGLKSRAEVSGQEEMREGAVPP
jgi:hypothetical protein